MQQHTLVASLMSSRSQIFAEPNLVVAQAVTAAWFGGSRSIATSISAPGLAPQQALLGQVAPLVGKAHPVAGPLIACGHEAVGVDGRVLVVAQRRDGTLRASRWAQVFAVLRQDAVDPGAQGRPALEPVDATEHAHPGLWATSSATAWLDT